MKLKEELHRLSINQSRRYEFNGNELHCGDVVELSIDGKKWVKTQIEHNGREYYATVNNKILLYGLYCRFPEVAK